MYIIVSIPSNSSYNHEIHKKFCGLRSDELFDSNLTRAMLFETSDQAREYFFELKERKKKDGFFAKCVIWEILC